MATLGFVGLGVMGGGMARRLLEAGHTVLGYNRTREKARPLEEIGLVVEDSPRAVAEAAGVVHSMVTNVAALKAVSEGPDGILAGLSPGKVWVDHSTAAPAVSRDLAARVREIDAEMVDAPVSGSVSTLEEGRLSIMVGGSREAFERVEPILRDIGPVVTHVGSNGQALLLKIAINLSLQVQMVAFSEGLLLAEKDGIDREVALEVMLGSVIASPMLKYRGPFVLELPDEAWFDVDMMQKDMNLALEAGRELDVPMPTTAVSNELLTAARGMGLAGEDFAVVYQVLAEMAGLRRAVR
ncbi:MAG: NAD(P)-dependent oxidoreductase [Thermoleophilia bacterium]|nr:NAD(P)-dependent oxidoreductase [Thermoleophilia bacterium]MDQ3858719.1 NAD(P)-dependent oxidoreductase [Actinomycetota bacterium]